MAHDVFISYSSRDKVTADAVCAILEMRGIRCWIAPRDILPGSTWAESIIDAIEGSRVMVLIFSGHANESVQIQREVERAVNKGLAVVPLRIENARPSKTMEYFISTPHWLDALTPPLDQHIERLADALQTLLTRVKAKELGAAAPGGSEALLRDAQPVGQVGAVPMPPEGRAGDRPVATVVTPVPVPGGGAPAPASGQPPAGATGGGLDKYDLQRLLGPGRFGSEVYAGVHKALGRQVAVRVLRRSTRRNWEVGRDRFLREARILQVSHPSLLEVRDFGEEPDLVYLVTELFEATRLREVIAAAGHLPWARATPLSRQLLGAAGAIHRRGGLLCGLSPDIILITEDEEGERLVVSAGGVSQVGDVMALLDEETLRGTGRPDPDLYYLAPELLVGQAPDVRSEVFSLGAIIYEMVTGRRPFEATTFPALLGVMMKNQPADPRAAQADLPDHVAEALLKALSADLETRPATAAELSAALFPKSS